MRPIEQLRAEIPHWTKVQDVIDQSIDLALNLSQSGHPGGSRSRVHALVTLLLSGAMRWDIRNPQMRFADRFVLVAGHVNPVVYATLAVLNHVLQLRHERTGDDRYTCPWGRDFVLLPEDLLLLRQNGGLPGHAEMEGRTLFLKANTGPSGHGAPIAAGQALALKHAGAGQVRVFAMEGEGGHTAGVHHEVKNSAYGLGLGNLVYLMDWNDAGIDPQPISAVVHGEPRTWFEPYGWRVLGTEQGSDFGALIETFHEAFSSREADPDRPLMLWSRTSKGRGYIVEGYKSHGAPHKYNSENFWRLRHGFAERHGVTFVGEHDPVPEARADRVAQTRENLGIALSVLAADDDLVTHVSDRLLELAGEIPRTIDGFKMDVEKDPLADPRLTDPEVLPPSIFLPPGTQAPNRKGFARFGAYANAVARDVARHPLFLVCAADLAQSTNIAGFGAEWEDTPGFGWYDRERNVDGAVLPQEITEFANSGIVCGLASVNFSERPFEEFRGFMGACSTYGSFSYLKYGPMRLYSQMHQDSQIKLGKVVWVAGHSGPETAQDSRTHFGIFAPGVTSLFPRGHVLNLHPWEPNEVPVVLTAALASPVPLIVLHLTRPPIEVPDRARLGMESHLAAARGAYVIRPFDPDRPPQGTVLVRGTTPTANIVKLLPWLESEGPNVKVVAAISRGLFRMQDAAYRERVLPLHEWADSMVVTNTARWNVGNWIPHAIAREYCLSPDFDDRWRTGGSVEQIVAEAGLDPDSIRTGIERFVAERESRLERLRAMAAGLETVGA